MEKLNIKKMVTASLLVVFVLAGILFNVSIDSPYFGRAKRVFGGPALTEVSDYTSDSVVAQSSDPENYSSLYEEADPYLGTESTVIGSNNPSGTSIEARDGTVLHIIEDGENLSIIAAKYGVSLNTILAANDVSDVIHPGDKLIVPPVSGVIHSPEGNESIDAIAALYGVPIEEIIGANDNLLSGNLIIPGATEKRSFTRTSLINYEGYYLPPADGRDWGEGHPYNATDTAGPCGGRVYASAEGGVTETFSDYGWNRGYGRMVTIEHPNNTKTLYAHLQSVSVSEGDFVAQGDVIGTIGNSGYVIGEGSKCHVHFEVHGAKNPFIL